MFGKNILKFGLPYGFDGRNAFYVDRTELPLREPWLILYLSALSIHWFGFDETGARMLFAVIGFLAIVMQYVFVRNYFHNDRLALINLVLIVTSISVILFLRQVRYYSTVMFLTPLIGYAYLKYKGRAWEILMVALLFLLFFFTNYLVAIPVLTAMAISFFVFDDRQKAVSFFLKPLPLVLLVIFPFGLWLCKPGWSDHPGVFRNIHPLDFGRIIYLYWKDYNATQLLPVIMIPILLILWWKEWKSNDHDYRVRIRKEVSILIVIVMFTLILSILSPQYSRAQHSDIRHATAIFFFLLLIQTFVLERVVVWHRWTSYLLIVVLIFTNVVTFMPFRSYLSEYVAENAKPFDNSVKKAVLFLEKRIHQDDMILVNPNHMLGTMQYYLGEKLLFCDVVDGNNPSVQVHGRKYPSYIYSSDVIPAWVVLFGWETDQEHTKRHLEKLLLKDYRAYRLPVFGPDVSRPELFWRSFSPVTGYPDALGLYILERIR